MTARPPLNYGISETLGKISISCLRGAPEIDLLQPIVWIRKSVYGMVFVSEDPMTKGTVNLDVPKIVLDLYFFEMIKPSNGPLFVASSNRHQIDLMNPVEWQDNNFVFKPLIVYFPLWIVDQVPVAHSIPLQGKCDKHKYRNVGEYPFLSTEQNGIIMLR